MTNITKNATEAKAFTHSGVFHADEVMATVLLSKIYDNLTVCRAFHVPENLPEGVIVYDIGNGKFDHHQKGGNGCRPENGVPYAACGLLWKEFGRELLKISEVSSDLIEFVWFLIDRDLIQGIDAADNGVLPKTDYPAQGLTISQMVSAFNPNWDNKKSADEAFLEAVAFAEQVFDNLLANALSKSKARAIVEEAIQASAMHIMVLEQFVPWQDFIFASKNEKAAEIQFVLYFPLYEVVTTGSAFLIVLEALDRENPCLLNGKDLKMLICRK